MTGDMNRQAGSGPWLNEALPTVLIDKVLYGIPERDARDRHKVWGAALSVAMSGYRRGWSYARYCNEITGEDRRSRHSGLWQQLCSRRNGRAYPDGYALRQLQRAWDTGVANVNDVGTSTKADVRADAVERAYRWADRLTDGADNLTATEAAVMGYVVAETERRGMTRVTCPAREVAEAAKVAPMTALRTLKVLTEKGC